MMLETDLVYYLIALLVLIIFALCIILIYSGLIVKIEVKTAQPPFGQLTVAYKFACGPYKNAGKLFRETLSLVPELKTIGVYYDDPQKVSPSDLRYVVGAILCESNAEPRKDHVKILKSNDYRLFTFPAASYAVMTTFPFTNIFSIFIGVARVYPKLADYIREHSLCAHPMIEIYEKDYIIFIAPLSRQDEFYVPEVRDEDEESSVITSRSEESTQTVDDSISYIHGTDTESLSGSIRELRGETSAGRVQKFIKTEPLVTSVQEVVQEEVVEEYHEFVKPEVLASESTETSAELLEPPSVKPENLLPPDAVEQQETEDSTGSSFEELPLDSKEDRIPEEEATVETDNKTTVASLDMVSRQEENET